MSALAAAAPPHAATAPLPPASPPPPSLSNPVSSSPPSSPASDNTNHGGASNNNNDALAHGALSASDAYMKKELALAQQEQQVAAADDHRAAAELLAAANGATHADADAEALIQHTRKSMCYKTYSPEDLIATLRTYLKTKNSGKNVSIRQLARISGIPYATLRDHISGRKSRRKVKKDDKHTSRANHLQSVFDQLIQNGHSIGTGGGVTNELAGAFNHPQQQHQHRPAEHLMAASMAAMAGGAPLAPGPPSEPPHASLVSSKVLLALQNGIAHDNQKRMILSGLMPPASAAASVPSAPPSLAGLAMAPGVTGAVPLAMAAAKGAASVPLPLPTPQGGVARSGGGNLDTAGAAAAAAPGLASCPEGYWDVLSCFFNEMEVLSHSQQIHDLNNQYMQRLTTMVQATQTLTQQGEGERHILGVLGSKAMNYFEAFFGLRLQMLRGAIAVLTPSKALAKERALATLGTSAAFETEHANVHAVRWMCGPRVSMLMYKAIIALSEAPCYKGRMHVNTLSTLDQLRQCWVSTEVNISLMLKQCQQRIAGGNKGDVLQRVSAFSQLAEAFAKADELRILILKQTEDILRPHGLVVPFRLELFMQMADAGFLPVDQISQFLLCSFITQLREMVKKMPILPAAAKAAASAVAQSGRHVVAQSAQQQRQQS